MNSGVISQNSSGTIVIANIERCFIPPHHTPSLRSGVSNKENNYPQELEDKYLSNKLYYNNQNLFIHHNDIIFELYMNRVSKINQRWLSCIR